VVAYVVRRGQGVVHHGDYLTSSGWRERMTLAVRWEPTERAGAKRAASAWAGRVVALTRRAPQADADVAALRAERETWLRTSQNLRDERDALKAEVERLRRVGPQREADLVVFCENARREEREACGRAVSAVSHRGVDAATALSAALLVIRARGASPPAPEVLDCPRWRAAIARKEKSE